MWNERYNNKDYVYGVEPNDFLKSHFMALPKGRILSLGEGEGRNAVFLAKQGYDVTAVDSSIVGLEKAQALARANGVTIETICTDLIDFDYGQEQWDAVISIFCPLPSKLRFEVSEKVFAGLKTGGIFLNEAYTPKQIQYGTGGGNDIDTMQTTETLKHDFPSLNFNHLVECEREVVEGIFHTGLASVVQAIGTKR